MTRATNWGLAATAPVRWLIDTNPDIKKWLIDFIEGRAEPLRQIIGPPDPDDLAHSQKIDQPCPLPVVTLVARKMKDHISGVPHCEVKTLKDEETDEVHRWREREFIRRRSAMIGDLVRQGLPH